MAVNFIFWNGNDGYDIHVVAGATSRTLNDLLVINHGNPGVGVFANAPIPHVTVNFLPGFNGTLAGTAFSGFGITVDENTGAVSVANPLPGPRFLRNFLIRALVIDTSVVPATTFIAEIRIHIHNTVTSAWLTPDALDIRRGADGLSFSVLAQFDDRCVGDISRVPGLAWASSAPGTVSVNAGTGALKAMVDSNHATITVTLPALWGGRAATSTVNTLVPWSTPVNAKLVPGSLSAAQMAQAINFLFLPDGFLAGEQALFERTAQSFITFLRSSPSARPFDLCSSQINYWMAFVPSSSRGTSPLYEINVIGRATGSFGQEVPVPVDPAGTPGDWTLAQLIHEVGLPIAAQGAVLWGPQLQEWVALYGVNIALHTNPAVHGQWAALAQRSLVNEQNTAFGMSLGERPRVAASNPPRAVVAHQFRTSRAQLDPFLSNLRNAAAPMGPAIGGVWGPGGKDRPFVVVLCAGSREGGARTPAPDELLAVGLTLPTEVEVAPVFPIGGFDLVPYSVPATSPLDVRCTVAHESAHALGLGDEYGEAGTLPAQFIPDVNANLNLQDAKSAAASPPGIGVDPTHLKWNWPRISKAGVLTGTPTAVGGEFDVPLKRGHAAKFAVGDFVRLRTRPLSAGIIPSLELTVTAVAGDTLRVHPSLPLFIPVIFVAGSIAYVQHEGVPVQPAVRGTPLGLISPTVLAHMTASGIPLNIAPIAPAAAVCTPDGNVVQPARNRPATLPAGKPRYTAWIVGAFEGGKTYGCGVYHPTGACMMRQLLLAPAAALTAFRVHDVAYRFCPVCRYILVDRIDPSQHGIIDAEYDSLYAVP